MLNADLSHHHMVAVIRVLTGKIAYSSRLLVISGTLGFIRVIGALLLAEHAQAVNV